MYGASAIIILTLNPKIIKEVRLFVLKDSEHINLIKCITTDHDHRPLIGPI